MGQIYDLTRVYESVPEGALWLVSINDAADEPVLLLRNSDWTDMLSLISAFGQAEYTYGWVYLDGMYRLCIRWPELHLALVVDFPNADQLVEIIRPHQGEEFKLALCDSRDFQAEGALGIVLDTVHFDLPL